MYRRQLAQAVSSGDLAAADSKAAYLQNLCEELQFDAEKAVEIHEGNSGSNKWQLSCLCNLHGLVKYKYSTISFKTLS